MDRLLAVLDQQVEVLRRTDRADVGTIRAIVDYMTRYPDRHHHPKENLILAKIEAANPSIADITTDLRRAHGLLARKGQELLAQLPGSARLSRQAQSGHLRPMLADYIVLMRRHMHYEESIVFDEAERLLRDADWQEIDAAVPPVADPIFGETTAPEYQALFNDYLNRATAVATGDVPVGLFELGASSAERVARTGGFIRNLPADLLNHVRSRVSDQQRRIRTLISSRDVEGARLALEDFGNACLAGPSEYYSLFRDALLAREHDNGASGPSTSSATATALPSEERMFRPSNLAGVSWQAATLNLLMRSTIKPLFTTLNTRRAKQVSDLVAKRQRPPDGVLSTPVTGQSFRAEWVRPIGLHVIPRRTILYLPGGGFFLPATAMHRAMLAKLSRLTKARSLLVHYRLAPDHPFPAGLDDAVAAYRYLLDSGTSPQDIVVAGDSAGGCLTLSLLLALREQDLPMPAGGALLSALTDLKFTAPSRRYNRWRDPMIPTGSTTEFLDTYTGDTARDNPLVSPIYGDYHGFPPMFAQVGSTEILIDDSLLIARKARSQGVDFEVEVWEGMPHVWQVAHFLPESKRALVRIATFCEKAWHRAHNPTAARRRRMDHERAVARGAALAAGS